MSGDRPRRAGIKAPDRAPGLSPAAQVLLSIGLCAMGAGDVLQFVRGTTVGSVVIGDYVELVLGLLLLAFGAWHAMQWRWNTDASRQAGKDAP